MAPEHERGWIVCEAEGGHVACYFAAKGDIDSKKAVCGGVARRVRPWILARDIGVIPLCENCKTKIAPRKKTKR
jgi:hypothetical protein